MSKAALDSDLYGDIYGDDELTDFPDGDPVSSPHEDEPTMEEKAQSPTVEAQKNGRGSLPLKPASPNLSYSAQIAQQFSVYQQTPSQERQQRTAIPLPGNPRNNAAAASTPSTVTSPIATIDTSSHDTVFGKKPSEMHDSGKLFIGGLSWDTTDGILPLHPIAVCSANAHFLVLPPPSSEGLRDYFSQFGKVDACTIMRDHSGTSKGFAFLTFEDANAVISVLAREHILDNKMIDPKRAIPREEHQRNTRYFVGGLSPNTTSESMKEFFSAYGKVADALVMVDRESGRSKGFGFVTYEDGSSADQLIGKIGLILNDKQIEVKAAQPRSQRDQARATSTANMGSGQNNPGFGQPMQASMANMGFTPLQQQSNQMGMMFNRPMGQMGMMGGNMPMMNMNPMAMMGMGMSGFNPMAAGMSGMNMMNGMGGMGMSGMGNMGGMAGAMGSMGNVAGMRLGMGPMGMASAGISGNPMAGNAMVGASGMGGMNAIGMAGMRNNMANMSGGGVGRTMGAAAVGPARASSRGQHSFHPYSR